MKNIANDLAIFLHIQGLKRQDDHWDKFQRQQSKGNWGSFETGRIRVSLPATRKVGFRWQSPKIDLGWQGWAEENLWMDRKGKAR